LPARVATRVAEGAAFPRDVRGSKTEMHVADGVHAGGIGLLIRTTRNPRLWD